MTEHIMSGEPSFERRTAVFLENYRNALRELTDTHLESADRIPRSHKKRLETLHENGEMYSEAWTDEELTTALNTTSSSVGKQFSATHSRLDGFLKESHETALSSIPDEDRDLWDEIQKQIGELGVDSEEVEQLFESASSEQAAEIMRIACDYPLWLFAQVQAQKTNIYPGLHRIVYAASSEEASSAIRAGTDYTIWRAINNQAIRYGPDHVYVSPDNASDERSAEAMRAGLDYRVAVAVFERRDAYDQRRSPSGAIKTALEAATTEVREVLEERLGGKYDDRYEEKAVDYYREMADEAAESFGDRPFTPEELLERMLNIRDGRSPDDAGDTSGGAFRGGESFYGSNPEIPDPYEILGVSPRATQREIKKAYRILARTHHSDVGGDEETMKRINSAHDIVGNPGKRAHYDTYGTLSGY